MIRVSSPWFFAFLAVIGWFLGLLIITTKTIGGTLGFGALAFVMAQIPRVLLPLPFVTQPRTESETWITVLGVVILVITLPFTMAAFQINPWLKPAGSQRLVTNGFFAFVRHPLMFRDSFWPLGWSLIFSSLIGACLTPVWLGLCWLMSVAEEESSMGDLGNPMLTTDCGRRGWSRA